MRILQVIHGYPMRYNAGSEVYTQGLAQALAERHEVYVFTRQENSFLREYGTHQETDPSDPRIILHVINMARARDGYRHAAVDGAFASLLDEVRPEVIHIGHLNHLSTSLLFAAKERRIPVVFTLHDYWLMCPRGQFIQMYPKDPTDVWALCDGQDDRKCAVRCYVRYYSGDEGDYETDAAYWTGWVGRRMAHVREVCDAVDVFIAPSRYLLRRFRDDFGIPERKLTYLDYGFHRQRMEGRRRVQGEPFTFGYIGTHIPAKGVNHLIESFGSVSGNPKLRIWGRDRGVETEGLKALARSLPNSADERIEWIGEYRNQDIVADVFELCDAIVVPSIWAENSPLVIHEALQARVPVITADYGGMAEYVHHERNGLLFSHRDTDSLAQQMQRLVDDPQLAIRLGSRGYLQSEDGNVPDMMEHSLAVEAIYKDLIGTRQ
ncbi:MAG: glycosyltransferase family 4 protein [Dehalococcoidia bacterium]|nr:glycosyltransferase family 4 protein [Dehalococcoidia bacterium]